MDDDDESDLTVDCYTPFPDNVLNESYTGYPSLQFIDKIGVTGTAVTG